MRIGKKLAVKGVFADRRVEHLFLVELLKLGNIAQLLKDEIFISCVVDYYKASYDVVLHHTGKILQIKAFHGEEISAKNEVGRITVKKVDLIDTVEKLTQVEVC